MSNPFKRLQGTLFTTNIRTGNKIETRIFSLVDEGGFVRTNDERFQLDYCEIVLSDWLMRAIESNEVVSISDKYFRLRRPLERRLYQIARKHCGCQPKWQIGLAKLQEKTGSNAPLKRFRLNLREIIKDNHTPFYRFDLAENDLVIVRPRQTKVELTPQIKIPNWAEDRARAIAHDKGWDYYVLRSNWLDFAKSSTANGKAPNNAGAAFVAWCKKQKDQRGY